MKRVLWLILFGAVIAFAVLYAVRASRKTSSAAVAALLPRDTIALAHLPNFNRLRDDWHRSDIYQIYLEPAVQDFLRKPLAQLPKRNAASLKVQEMQQLDLKDGFLALTSMANENPKIVAGFRFRGDEQSAEKIIGQWRAQLMGAATKSETVDYQQHKIELAMVANITLATAYDGHWFFAATDLDQIKALIDRADGRATDPQSLLTGDETFHSAMKRMPPTYALGFYLQPKSLMGKIAAWRGAHRQQTGGNEELMLERVRCVCATTRFDNGRMRDVIFIGMPPKIDADLEITRHSLALASKDTFFYLASFLNVSKRLALFDPTGAGNALGFGLQKIERALSAAKITEDDWRAAFGWELGALADWPPNAHWPSAVVTFPVKDAARAKQIAGVLAHGIDEDARWSEADRNGVHYWKSAVNGFITLHPTIALSGRVMVIGVDETTVEAAMRRSESSSSELASSPTYRKAASEVPAPTNFFAYVDSALLYSRLDAAIRPLLLMGAAFLPAVNEQVELDKWPPSEVITRHLSPIVSSQRYDHDGYVTESVGPITLNQAAIGILAAIGAGAYQRGVIDTLSALGSVSALAAPPSPSKSPSPASTP
jgi:hypothetical protein